MNGPVSDREIRSSSGSSRKAVWNFEAAGGGRAPTARGRSTSSVSFAGLTKGRRVTAEMLHVPSLPELCVADNVVNLWVDGRRGDAYFVASGGCGVVVAVICIPVAVCLHW